ncbi:hypothetical protein FA95DRAFT_1558133 [Auriscalpium vulgare]|uniref:Uncharacterized protein n=1 Tax=Auriscalpium vulgare TaxID=40419 RepID=A0ACB8RXM3_9AGAM|nr:hypothetical protein FA95DRAFT_1558133 [Auriscalpium vulgare]
MSATDPWSEFDTLRVTVRQNTVDRLKQIIAGFNEECWTILSKTGKKQDLIDRIIFHLDEWRNTNNVDKWNKARAIFHQVRTSGIYRNATHITAPASAPPYAPATAARPFATPSAGPSVVPRYDPYSQRVPIVPMSSSTIAGATSAAATHARPAIRFKPSPFFQVEHIVSSVVECPESSNSTDRRSQVVLFTLTPEHVAKLNGPGLKYQLRLYCTSSSYFALGSAGVRFGNAPCPIEFPPTCEIRVNTMQITANTKGLKKKPGTAPSADLGKTVRMAPGSQNRVEIVYVNNQTNNNQQPPPPKKYYIAVMLVQVTTVDQLIERVKKGKYRSTSDVLAQMRKSSSDDDDIVAGPVKMSLKCPLSYCRITTPCRSSQCVHPSCFDALSWYSINEQTTTWSCPICEKAINHEDLIVDGYFDEILKNTSDEVDDVMVEADGEWHTSDDKFSSTGWRATHPPSSHAPSTPSTPRKSLLPSPSHSPSGTTLVNDGSVGSNGKDKGVDRNSVVILDDSDDEDEGRVKRELSPSRTHQSVDPVPSSQVIDLTLDSDDEEAPSQRTEIGKRKAVAVDSGSPTEQIWKKSRVESPPHPTVMRNVNGNVSTSASNPSTSGSDHGGRPYNMNGISSQHWPPAPQHMPYPPYDPPYTMPYYPDTSRSGSDHPRGTYSSYISPYTRRTPDYS